MGVPEDLRSLVHDMICSDGKLTAADIGRIVGDLSTATAASDQQMLGLKAPELLLAPQPLLQRSVSAASTASTVSTATQTDREASVEPLSAAPASGALAELIAEKMRGLSALADVLLQQIEDEDGHSRGLRDDPATAARVLKEGLVELEALAFPLSSSALAS